MCADQHGRQGGIIIGIGCEKDDSCRKYLERMSRETSIPEPSGSRTSIRTISCRSRLSPHSGGFGSCLADDGNAPVVVYDGSQAHTDYFDMALTAGIGRLFRQVKYDACSLIHL
jgi:hypothetical protein